MSKRWKRFSLPKATRRKVFYSPEKGDRVPAYLFVPLGIQGRRPAVLCLHQTISMGKGEPAGLGGDKPYALETGRARLRDHRPRTTPISASTAAIPTPWATPAPTMKGVWNHIRAVDLLQSMPEVDSRSDRGHRPFARWGHNAIFAALFDLRIKAVVSSCGFQRFSEVLRGASWRAGATGGICRGSPNDTPRTPG
jgi:hypothetical protein